jgi:hypothetical protein
MVRDSPLYCEALPYLPSSISSPAELPLDDLPALKTFHFAYKRINNERCGVVTCHLVPEPPGKERSERSETE